jgi:hypothetical protein
MQTDSLLNQTSAGEMDLAPLRYVAWTREASINARRPPFDGLTISLHWGTVLLVLILFSSAWLHALAETLQSDFTPVLLQTASKADSAQLFQSRYLIVAASVLHS